MKKLLDPKQVALSHQITPGMYGRMRIAHSEVAMHMRVAGSYMDFHFLENGRSVQLFKDKQPFSSSILPSEAGIFWDAKGFYYYPHGHEEPTDELANQPPFWKGTS